MEITEVRVKLVSGKNDKLRAFCSITIDNDFVVRDLKVIDGVKGPFVAMPSRKIMERCPGCGGKNHYRARFCNDCGRQVGRDVAQHRSAATDDEGHEKSKFHAEIAHPINAGCREVIQTRVLEKFQEELDRPGTADSVAAARATSSHEDYDDYFGGDRRADPVADEGSRSGSDRLHDLGRRDAAVQGAADDGRRSGDGPDRIAYPGPAFDEPGLAAGSSSLQGPSPGSSAGMRKSFEEEGRTRDRGVDEGPDAGQTRKRVAEEPREGLEPEDNFGAGILP